MTAKVLVLGGMGMLGSALVRKFEEAGLSVVATARDCARVDTRLTEYRSFSVGDSDLSSVLEGFGEGDFVVNCIGLIKHHLDDSNMRHRLDAIRVNAEFPYDLVEIAEETGFHVIQIATDCVYAGTIGLYDENAPHDAHDVYGKSKSLGEVPSPHLLNLRCSIIGRELGGNTSLVEWLLSQPVGGTISGYRDHFWNGVTTKCFAEIAAGLIAANDRVSGSFHIVPATVMSKSELARVILREFGRSDVNVVPTATENGVNRTLSTLYPATNQHFWDLAGYAAPPTIEEMVRAIAQ
jgi:dTDP-4-dehydrorhamnose reductase